MTQPIIIGLTGSIGMGKSTISKQFAALGAKLCNADHFVHVLMNGGAAVPEVQKYFPDVIENGAVNRKKLGQIVFADKQKLHILETILHPLVIGMEEDFIKKSAALGAKIVVMDIPLLLETGGQERCDMVVVASAPFFIQKQRVMARPNMTLEKFHHILAAQMPDHEKRSFADFIIDTGLGKAHSFRQVKSLMQDIASL